MDIIDALEIAPQNKKNEILIPENIKKTIRAAARIINIEWIESGLNTPVKIICPRQSTCPRHSKCTKTAPISKRISWVEEIKDKILANDQEI